MRLINVLFFLYAKILIAQASCAFNEMLDRFILSEVQYTEQKKERKSDINLSTIFLDNRTQYLGFIGENKKRLFISLRSVEQKLDDTNCYDVNGEAIVYRGAKRRFNGEFEVMHHYGYKDLLDEEISYAPQVLHHGFSILRYKLFENKKLASTGIFEGIVLVQWYKDKNGKLHYDETLGFNPSYSNCTFIGIWKSFKTAKKFKTGWAHYRILCSDDLDIGASEFSPNKKYHKYGWADYWD